MHRHSSCRFFWANLILVVSMAAPLRGEQTDAELGIELRDALGFGSQAMSALGVTGETYGLLVSDAETSCSQNRETVEPLLTAVRVARCARMGAYENAGDIETAEQTFTEAVQSLSSACATVKATMTGRLSQPQQAKQARFAASLLLDPALALVDLDSEQRQSILSAQRTRDQVLKHGRQRKDLEAVAAAMATYRAAMMAVLSQGQEEELATLETSLRANAATAQANDESSLNPS